MLKFLELGNKEKLKPGVDASNWLLLGQDLSGMDLSNVNFEGALLANCNLSNSNLTGCNFTKADLCGTNLEGCNLAWAKLSHVRMDELTKVEGIKNKRINRVHIFSPHSMKKYTAYYYDGIVNIYGIEEKLTDLVKIIKNEVPNDAPTYKKILDFRLDNYTGKAWILMLAKKYLKAYTGNSRVLEFTPRSDKDR